jgi:hypothetical protein
MNDCITHIVIRYYYLQAMAALKHEYSTSKLAAADALAEQRVETATLAKEKSGLEERLEVSELSWNFSPFHSFLSYIYYIFD